MGMLPRHSHADWVRIATDERVQTPSKLGPVWLLYTLRVQMRGATNLQMQQLSAFVLPKGAARHATVASQRLEDKSVPKAFPEVV